MSGCKRLFALDRYDGLEGIRFLRRNTTAWANTVFSLIAQLALPAVNGLTPVFLVRRFAGNDVNAGAVQFGGSEAAIALGAVLASAVLPRFAHRFPKGRLLVPRATRRAVQLT